MISIREKWSANKSWHSYYPYIIVYSETNNITHIIVESQLFESDKRLFDFIIQLANLIDEETTSDEIKQYVRNYDPKTGFTEFIKKTVRSNLQEKE